MIWSTAASNETIEALCRKGKSSAQIVGLLTGSVGRSGVFKAFERFEESGKGKPGAPL